MGDGLFELKHAGKAISLSGAGKSSPSAIVTMGWMISRTHGWMNPLRPTDLTVAGAELRRNPIFS